MFVALHAGAGSHKQTRDERIKAALRECVASNERVLSRQLIIPTLLRACRAALQPSVASPVDAVQNAISILEDDPCLNAGLGSNLSMSGTVECDASIMSGPRFGAIGAVTGVRHPIHLARSILEHSRVPDPLGRIRPLYALRSGFKLI
jgi:taspase, threonine aspartase, 1